MATLTEIHELMSNASLLDRVQAATIVAAEVARDAPPLGIPAESTRKWVAQVAYEPSGEAQKAWRIMLGSDGPNATKAQILALDDAGLQTRVNDAVEDLIRMFDQL